MDAGDVGQMLVGIRDGVERSHLEVVRGDVVARGEGDHHRRFGDLGGEGDDVVGEEELDRLDRVPVLVQRSLARLDVVEGGMDVGERPGRQLVGERRGRRHRDLAARLALEARLAVGSKDLPQLREAALAMAAPHGLETVDHRHGADGEGRAVVEGRDDHDVAAGIGDPPHARPLDVDPGQRLGEGEGVPVVLDLLPGIEVLARLAAAFAEIAIVETERRAADVLEELGVVGHHDLFRVAPPAGHHDDRHITLGPCRARQGADQCVALAVELDSLTHVQSPCPAAGWPCRVSSRSTI
jgi:hypothetical protein